MKKYKLLKDLPGISAGTEYEEDGVGNLVRQSQGRIPKNDFEYISVLRKREEWFPEWFQEIPYYSFVRDGDVFRDPEDGSLIRYFDGYSGCWSDLKEEVLITVFHIPKESWYQHDSHVRTFKPENLVYRPGPTPGDPPLVDKLGWGPMASSERSETKKTFYVTDWNGQWFVMEQEERPFVSGSRGTFKTKEDAERFRALLEDDRCEK